jgi:lysophospholipase L1-like esterase
MNIKGKSIAFLGDSITEGVGASSNAATYHALIKNKCALSESLNLGISGTRISRQTVTYGGRVAWDRCFIDRVESIPLDVDLLVVFGGTNDYDHGDASLGSFDDRSEYTFYGALHSLVKSIRKRLPDATVVFMTPLKRVGESPENAKVYKGFSLYEYVAAIKTVMDHYNIPVLDLYNESGIEPCDPENRKQNLADEVHINDNGHKVVAEMLVSFLAAL